MRTHILLFLLLLTLSSAKRTRSNKFTSEDLRTPLIQLLLSSRPRAQKWRILAHRFRKQFPTNPTHLLRTLRKAYPTFSKEASKGFPTIRNELYAGLKTTYPHLLKDATRLKSQLHHTFTTFLKPFVRDLSWHLLRLDLSHILNSHTLILPNLSLLFSRLWSFAQLLVASFGFATGDIYGLLLLLLLFLIWRPSTLDFLISRVVGPLMLALGVALCVRACSDLGFDNFSIYAAPAANGYLVTDGVYATIRHPMYAGLIVAAFGLALASRSMARLGLAVVVVAVVMGVVEVEEGLMEGRFAMYSFYADRVRARFIPGIY